MRTSAGKLGTLPAAMQSVVDWLDHGQSLVGARSVIAECDMEVIEIVYVERRDDRLLVSDRGDTVRYFEAGDSVLKPLGVAEISRICERFGATLVAVADMWPHITVDSSQVQSVDDATRIVANAIDRVANAAGPFPFT